MYRFIRVGFLISSFFACMTLQAQVIGSLIDLNQPYTLTAGGQYTHLGRNATSLQAAQTQTEQLAQQLKSNCQVVIIGNCDNIYRKDKHVPACAMVATPSGYGVETSGGIGYSNYVPKLSFIASDNCSQ